MVLQIKGTDYKVTFGIGFLRELDKKYCIERSGMKFGASMDYKIPLILAGDVVTLSDVLYTATCTEDKRPSQKDVDEYIDGVEDIGALFDEVVEELKKSNATKIPVTRIQKALGDVKK